MPRNSLDRLLARTMPVTFSDRFEKPCAIWLGGVDRDGYGKSSYDGKFKRAHRLVWELTNGPIEDGAEIDHLCKQPSCIEITHLEPVTRRTNWERSDCPSSISRRKNECYAGHDLDEHGYVNPNTGVRSCRKCKREWQREYRRALADAAGRRGADVGGDASDPTGGG